MEYAAIAGVTTLMAVGFRTSTKVDAGAHIVLHKPLEFYMFCSQEATKRVSLPGILYCDTSIPWLYDLTVNDTMAPGDYAFATMVIVPPVQPQNNTFSIIIYDSNYLVQDAHMHLPAKDLVKNLGLSSMPLTWTASDPGVESVLEMGFSVDKKLAVDQMFSLIVLVFPDGFIHTITEQSDVEITRKLPVLQEAVDWELHSSDPEEMAGSILRINLDLSQEIMVDVYTIAFPVIIPTTLPPWNVWQMYICQTNDCNVHPPETHNVLVAFSVVGFEFGQIGPKSQGTRAAAMRTGGFALLLFVIESFAGMAC
jgi:hypothetical protein